MRTYCFNNDELSLFLKPIEKQMVELLTDGIQRESKRMKQEGWEEGCGTRKAEVGT